MGDGRRCDGDGRRPGPGAGRSEWHVVTVLRPLAVILVALAGGVAPVPASPPGGPGPGRSRRACSRGGRGRRGGRRAGPGRSGPPVRAAAGTNGTCSAARLERGAYPLPAPPVQPEPCPHPRCRQLARRRRRGPVVRQAVAPLTVALLARRVALAAISGKGIWLTLSAGFPAQCPCCRGHGTTGRAAPALGADWRIHRLLLRRRGPEKARTGRRPPASRSSPGTSRPCRTRRPMQPGQPRRSERGRRLQRGHRDGV